MCCIDALANTHTQHHFEIETFHLQSVFATFYNDVLFLYTTGSFYLYSIMT